MRKAHVASGTAALALLMGGCADDSDPTDARGSSETSGPFNAGASPSTSSDSFFDKAAASSAAKSALLVIGDFPAGWASTTPEADEEGDQAFQEKFTDCLKAPDDLFSDNSPGSTSEDSLDFNSPDENTTISSSVSIAVPGKMRQFFELIKGDTVNPCLAQVLDE